MRINGRVLRPSTLAERRVLKSLRLDYLRVPRSVNPFTIARQLSRLARGGDAMELLRKLATHQPAPPQPWPHPVPDTEPAAQACAKAS